MLKRVRHAAHIDPEAEVRRPLAERRVPGRGSEPGPDEFVDGIAQAYVPLLAHSLNGSSDIIVKGQRGTHGSMITSRCLNQNIMMRTVR
jgi:hypothetical protein